MFSNCDVVGFRYLFGKHDWLFKDSLELCFIFKKCIKMVLRVCFKQCLSKVITRLPQRINPMMELLRGKHAFKLVLLSRLTPLPFGLMNAFFAVSEVSNCDYILASVLGLLPTQAINAYIGEIKTNPNWWKSNVLFKVVKINMGLHFFLLF